MQNAEKADLVSKYTDRVVEDMGYSELVDLAKSLVWQEKMDMDEGELVDEIMELYPDLIPEEAV